MVAYYGTTRYDLSMKATKPNKTDLEIAMAFLEAEAKQLSQLSSNAPARMKMTATIERIALIRVISFLKAISQGDDQ